MAEGTDEGRGDEGVDDNAGDAPLQAEGAPHARPVVLRATLKLALVELPAIHQVLVQLLPLLLLLFLPLPLPVRREPPVVRADEEADVLGVRQEADVAFLELGIT